MKRNLRREVLGKFEAEWLGKASLPKPVRFVLCCPNDFTNQEARDEWEKRCEEFQKRVGVKLGYWSRSYLDVRLRKSPDIVADLFSDRIAQVFCDDLDDWKPDLFWPVKEGAPQPRRLKRYYERPLFGVPAYGCRSKRAVRPAGVGPKDATLPSGWRRRYRWHSF